jgi:hypothetical protein
MVSRLERNGLENVIRSHNLIVYLWRVLVSDCMPTRIIWVGKQQNRRGCNFSFHQELIRRERYYFDATLKRRLLRLKRGVLFEQYHPDRVEPRGCK